MTCACGSYNLGGSATVGIRAHTWIYDTLLLKFSKGTYKLKVFEVNKLKMFF
jgi:hypothetical protein